MFTAETVPAVGKIGLSRRRRRSGGRSARRPRQVHRSEGVGLLVRRRRRREHRRAEVEGTVRRTGGEDRPRGEVHPLCATSTNNSPRSRRAKPHIAGLNTGIVPTAVQRDGFVPALHVRPRGRHLRLHDAVPGAGRQQDQEARRHPRPQGDVHAARFELGLQSAAGAADGQALHDDARPRLRMGLLARPRRIDQAGRRQGI